MIELIGGSEVYLHKSQLPLCKSSCRSRSSLVRQLLRVSFTDEELVNSHLSTCGEGDFDILYPHIINVIKGNLMFYNPHYNVCCL